MTALQPLQVRWSALIPDHHSGISSDADFSSYKTSTTLRVFIKCQEQKGYCRTCMAKEIHLMSLPHDKGLTNSNDIKGRCKHKQE